ncbi:MAG: hypothetical protein K9J37_01565 [Saprospiraceae bacterium]|nr:hypothetical protein [Saprospiraceae bacterium]MCF8280269.1 hypothetical protein [Bacteroidales bacterium]MCF8439263.1 hypothetical protein [Saprospiraceae bacterium]
MVIGLAPKITVQEMEGRAINFIHLTDSQMFMLVSLGVKTIAAVLLTLAFDSWKRGQKTP